MTTANYSPCQDPWNFDWLKPQPQRDRELIDRLGFLPGLREMLILRQVHALEHATVWVLSELSTKRRNLFDSVAKDDNNLGGLSTEKGFYLYGSVSSERLKQAARLALERLKRGEWNLALHPRCGTNSSVGTALTVGLVLTAHIMLPKEPISQLIGFGVATQIAHHLTPEIGASAQKYLTTAIPFNLEIGEAIETIDIWGRAAHFLRVSWQEN